MMLPKRRTEGPANASMASDLSGFSSRRWTRTTQGKKPDKFGSFVVELHGHALPQRHGHASPHHTDPPNVNVDNVNAPEEPHHADIDNQHNNVNAPEEEKDTAGDNGAIDDDGSDNNSNDISSDDEEEKEKQEDVATP